MTNLHLAKTDALTPALDDPKRHRNRAWSRYPIPNTVEGIKKLLGRRKRMNDRPHTELERRNGAVAPDV